MFPPQLPLYSRSPSSLSDVHLHSSLRWTPGMWQKGIMGVKEAGKQHVGCIYLQVTRAGLPADHTIIVGIHCSESILHSSGHNRTVQQDHQIIRLFKDCPKSWFKLPIPTEISYLKTNLFPHWLPFVSTDPRSPRRPYLLKIWFSGIRWSCQ